jgi:outer membrane protein assembly factor BamB
MKTEKATETPPSQGRRKATTLWVPTEAHDALTSRAAGSDGALGVPVPAFRSRRHSSRSGGGRVNEVRTTHPSLGCRKVCIGAAAALAMGMAVLGGGCSNGPDTSKDAEKIGVTRSALGTVNWLSRGFDNGRTSANTLETTLTQGNVLQNASNSYFGKLFDLPVDDQVYAQVLYASAVPISGSSVNVIYVATVNNTVYAFNADTGAPVWTKPANLNNGFRPPTTGEISNGCTDLSPGKNSLLTNAGIVGTPVIDSSSSTLYAAARIMETSGIVYRLFALDITTGAFRRNPRRINPGNSNLTFNARYENQRPGLALSQGAVYVGFAGNCDTPPYHGWLVGYDATTLAQTGWFASTGAARAGDPGSGGGIWMGGGAPTIDSSGNVYVSTGNGTMPPGGEYAESVVKLAPRTLAVTDFFSPSNYSIPDANDEELGSAAPVLLPGRNRVVQIGKPGILYQLSQSSLGGIGGTVQTPFQAVQNVNCNSTHVFGGPVAWVGDNATDPLNLYVAGECDYIRAYRYRDSTGLFDTQPFATSQGAIPTTGAMMSLSSNGTTPATGILWATSPIGGSALYALNPDTLQVLWSSNVYARDSLVFGSRYHPPVIANGKVYVGTFAHAVSVFGLRTNAHVTGYFDQHGTEFVFYVDASVNTQALSCGSGGCWRQSTVDSTGDICPFFPITSFSDGTTNATNGHFFFESQFANTVAGIEELNGSPPSTQNTTNINRFSGYLAVPEAHSAFWDGAIQHIFMAAGAGDGTLHEVYNTGQLFDHPIPKCPYAEFGSSPRYVTAYWDGSIQHVIFDCVNDQSPFVHELWETYNSGQWHTHSIATTANGGSVPYGQFAGGAFGGAPGILGVGVAGSNSLVYTSISAGVWKSVSIPVPSLSYNSTVVLYPDSAGLRYFFVGANGHVYSLSSPGAQNTIVDLSVSPGQSSLANGTKNFIGWTSDLAGFFDGTNDHVFFIGADSHVHEFYGRAVDPFTAWVEHPISSGAFLP